VSFREAETALHDPVGVLNTDRVHSLTEDQFRLIGAAASGRLLVVIFAVDPAGTIRVISARRPTRRERHAYEDRGPSPLDR